MSEKKFEIYSIGPCKMSVCTDIDDEAEIELRANQESPTGITSQWAICTEPTFRGGEPNPCTCENDSTRKHWLLEC